MASTVLDRTHQLQRGVWLEYFTIGYNSLEGLIAIVAGLMAGSVALVGFGLDSAIEVTSGAALVWRLKASSHGDTRDAVALRIVGACFIVLAIHVGYDGLKSPHRWK